MPARASIIIIRHPSLCAKFTGLQILNLMILQLICLLCVVAKKTEDDIEDLVQAAKLAGIYAVDQLVENRWEILKAVTGKDMPAVVETIKAQTFVKETIEDAVVGNVVRRFWIPLTVCTGLLLGIAFYTCRKKSKNA